MNTQHDPYRLSPDEVRVAESLVAILRNDEDSGQYLTQSRLPSLVGATRGRRPVAVKCARRRSVRLTSRRRQCRLRADI